MSTSGISVLVEEPAWKKTDVPLARVKSVARLAHARGIASSFLTPAKRGVGAPEGRRGPSCDAIFPLHRFAVPLPRASAGEERGPRLTLLLTNDERLRTLNKQFRGKDAPTNVLSFPSGADADLLGDIAIALGVTRREAAAAGITLEAHTLHLAVHGVLHLLGYDHVNNREARVMESLEAVILEELGIPSPYAHAAVAR